MTALDAWRATQHEHETYPCDAELELFCNTVDPRLLALERLAHGSEIEWRAARRTWRAS